MVTITHAALSNKQQITHPIWHGGKVHGQHMLAFEKHLQKTSPDELNFRRNYLNIDPSVFKFTQDKLSQFISNFNQLSTAVKAKLLPVIVNTFHRKAFKTDNQRAGFWEMVTKAAKEIIYKGKEGTQEQRAEALHRAFELVGPRLSTKVTEIPADAL